MRKIFISGASSGYMLGLVPTPSSKLYAATPRIQRDKTLDGGVVMINHGFAAGDSAFQVTAKLSESDETILQAIVENETLISLSTEHGFFEGAVNNLTIQNGQASFNFLIKEQIV